jgi:sulfide:quinone oxidoreductase
MKKLVILGAGTAGTMVANHLSKLLPKSEWQIAIIDKDDNHLYQPGLLLLPFGVYKKEQLIKPRKRQVNDRVQFIFSEIEKIEAEDNKVILKNSDEIEYDYLVIATGTSPRPDQTPGLDDSAIWYKSAFDFYTLEGSVALQKALENFSGGKLVVHITELPLKCPVAPLEFAFLADAYFKKRGIRDQVQIQYVTPLEGAFTKPVSSKTLGYLLEERDIHLETDYVIERVDPESKTMYSMDEREVVFDLLVTVPLNMGADFIGSSGLGDELNYVSVDKETFLSTEYKNIFALGDANNIPASKAGSVAHFAVEIFAENFVKYVNDLPMEKKFDGHANCFIESGYGKGLLIDFNYTTEPLPGKFPIPMVGPMSLLKESRINHFGKLAFRWIYWNMLLPGRKIPISTSMQMSGKKKVEG